MSRKGLPDPVHLPYSNIASPEKPCSPTFADLQKILSGNSLKNQDTAGPPDLPSHISRLTSHLIQSRILWRPRQRDILPTLVH